MGHIQGGILKKNMPKIALAGYQGGQVTNSLHGLVI